MRRLNGPHAGFAVRRHTGGIEFDPDDVHLQTAQHRLVICLKKQCHVRLEERTVTGGMNGGAIAFKPLSVVHGRDKVRHDHRPCERLRTQRRHCLQHITFAQVQMHVEGE